MGLLSSCSMPQGALSQAEISEGDRISILLERGVSAYGMEGTSGDGSGKYWEVVGSLAPNEIWVQMREASDWGICLNPIDISIDANSKFGPFNASSAVLPDSLSSYQHSCQRVARMGLSILSSKPTAAWPAGMPLSSENDAHSSGGMLHLTETLHG